MNAMQRNEIVFNGKILYDFQQKQEFIRANKQENEDSLSADKMSEFYKSFLDSNWKTHFNYNREW